MRHFLSLGSGSPLVGVLFASTGLALALLGGCGSGASSDDASCVTTTTCQAANANCGQIVDNCNRVLECGACAEGQTCGAAGPNLCGVGVCDPYQCGEAGQTCGLLADGCGTVWSCGDECASAGTGGAPGTGGGGPGTGGAPGTGGTPGGISPLGEGVFSGSGTATSSNDGSGRYAKGTVIRDAQWYRFLVNGWGDWGSSTASWLGTSFTVSMAGATNGAGVPVGYPCMYCGNYADETGQTKCGLPIEIATATQVKTGWIWDANGNGGQYNAAWDIWLGNGTTRESFLMVWLREPQGQQPAGSFKQGGVSVGGQTWDVWSGMVNVGGQNYPIVNFVRPEGQDIHEFEFDVLAFHAKAVELGGAIGTTLPGTHINSVAVGFEVWNSVTNVKTVDFYVDAK